MTKYRKTALIEATQWFKMGDHPAVEEHNDIDGSGEMRGWVDTLEGGHIVTPGDWIATGVRGEHWPIKPDIFAATYEPVDTQDDGDFHGQRSDWQPIETAPWHPPAVLLWKESTEEHYVAARIRGAHGPGWCTPDGFQIFNPTHWMHLPAPPKDRP
jgi:hypothetical protein